MIETTVATPINDMVRSAGRLLHPLSGSTGSRRKTYRHLGSAASTVHQGGAQNTVHEGTDQRHAEYIPCRHQ